jgi:preprotein translocase subunit SecA
MDYLREGISLRAMAQRDPLVEYQREGFDMFSAMMDGIQEQSVGLLFHLEVEIESSDGTPEPPVPSANGARTRAARTNGTNGTAPSEDGAPALDEALLAAAQQAREQAEPDKADPPRRGSANPQISAKGLDRSATPSSRPLVYSAPTLDSATPEVRTESAAGDDGAPKRNAPRANPNRGSRGNRSNNARKRRS